jgi:formate dehydrogenase major subunit
MTNHFNDVANSDVILVIGSNCAENHPAAFHHITVAKQRGAKLISVDPRYTRTTARSDIYAPLRSGTDIAFIGGMIKYVIDDIEKNPSNYNMTYITEYTNAAILINPDYKGPADLNGVFSGWDATKKTYSKATWTYQLDENGIPKKDKTLKDPNCVFQLLKKQYARYDVDKVSKITGTPKELFLNICQTFASTGKTGKAGNILYAMGTTQHTYGAQNVRVYAVLQLLLGNIGIAGGGIQALRGEHNVQGSTDMALLAHILPGYLLVPVSTDKTLKDYTTRATPTWKDTKSLNWWGNTPKYITSLLKAWYGDAATKANDFAFSYLPKVTGNANAKHSHIALFEAMYQGTIKGFVCIGQNPAVGGPNSLLERDALHKLDWLVCADLWETETASFWKRPGVNPADVKTEVFVLPAACHYEKEGTVTNSGRWVQWRYKGADSPGDAKPDLDIIYELGLKLKELYKAGGPNADAIAKLTWDYGHPPTSDKVLREINGYDLTTGKLVTNFTALKDDGTTSCGEWVYSGCYNETGNMTKRRDLDDGPYKIGLFSKWAWCWPVNRRVVYNRASVDLKGEPWDKEHPIIWWKEGKWTGDVPDGGAKPMAEGGNYAFIMCPDGYAHLFGGNVAPRTAGLADGPFPEHYEPWESPIKNPMSGTQTNPVLLAGASAAKQQGTPDKYPYVATTYRVVEHWQSGAMTRHLPWLCELMPEMFVEISEELAAELGIKNAAKVIVESARGNIEAKALVTKRFKPLQVDGKVIHEIGMPWHWGYSGIVKGDSANVLTPHVGDANTMIPEYKAFLVNLKKA